MKQLILFYFALFLFTSSYAQSYKEEYATKLSNTLQFPEAYPVWAEMATKSLKKNENNWIYLRKAIEAAYNSEQFDKALYWSEKLTASPEMNETDWVTYFDVLQLTNNHPRLSGAIDSALMRWPQSNLIQLWKKNLPVILNQLNENSEYSVANFRQVKMGEEFCAVPYKDGYVLVSNRRNTGFVNRNYSWTGQYFTDLITISGGSDLEKDLLWKEIKRTNPHDGPISFSTDLKTAILTVNQQEIDQVGKVKFSRLQLKIYREKGGKWVEEDFPFNNKSYSVGHGVMDVDGSLIFASDKPGGIGGVDLYRSVWKDGAWGEPVNLGAKVNSVGDEVFPFVSNNGTLYFSSNGWPGNGGLDVFYIENKESNPKHIGNPVNTNADDFGIYIDENTGKGFLSSNRNQFKDEVYTLSKPVFNIDAEILLTTCDNKPITKQNITIKNMKTQVEEKLSTDDKGKAQFKPTLQTTYQISYAGDGNSLPCSLEKTFDKEGKITVKLISNFQHKTVKLTVVDENGSNVTGAQLTYYSNGKVSKKILTDASVPVIQLSNQEMAETDSVVANMINYSDAKVVFSKETDCNANQTYSLTLRKKSGSESINLGMVYYDFDLWFLRPEGKAELDKLVKYMKEHPDLTVELGSHTDSRGSDYYNEWLSERRSQSCIKYIKNSGIPANKIIAKGYGEKQLVNNCSDGVYCSEDDHQLNRRTELKIKLN